MRSRWLLTAFLAVIMMPSLPAARGQVPEQFRVWGKRAAAHDYLGDPGPEGRRAVDLEVAAQESARGFLVFSKPPAAVVSPDYVPAPAERCTRLEARDCPGQYGPITFTVFALKGGEFSVDVTDLAGPDGGSIGAENLDVRAVRYVRVRADDEFQTIPLLIEAFDAKTVPGARLQQFWITYYIPEGTPAGTYEGLVRISVGGEEKLVLPLRLRVNPFRLIEPDADLYFYYSNSTDPSDLELIYKELVDQRCHGMNMGMIVPPVTRDGDLPREALVHFLDAYKRAGFARARIHVGLWNRITSEWLNTPDRDIGMWGPWFRYYPFSEELDERYVRTVRMIHEETKKRGVELMLAVADEAGSHAWTIEATQHYNDLIKAELPEVTRELTVGGGWATGQPEHDLWKGRIHVWTSNRWLADKLEIVRRNDPEAEVGLYNMGGAGSAVGGLQSVRILYGFFNWKARADGVAQWVYYHGSTPKHNYAWPAEDPSDGRVPTLRWEAVREGAKDRRYLATLERLLADRQGAVAGQAREFLDEVAAQVVLRTDTYDPVDGGRVPAHPPGTYDRWRSQIADFIEALNAAP